MLIQFSVENFRSIAHRQTLSMAAAAGSAKRFANSMPTKNAYAPSVLRSACLFGPNGAGKSSIITAVRFFERFVLESATRGSEGDEIEVEPFKFDNEYANSPSEFEAIFVTNEALYQYGFSADRSRVFSEWLFSRSNDAGSRMRPIFQRDYDPETDTYEWEINESAVKGERETWKAATRSNALFLSTAVQLNSVALRDPYNWVRNSLRIIRSPERLQNKTTSQMILEGGRETFVDFLQSSGINIVDIRVNEEDFVIPKSVEEMFHEKFLQRVLKDADPKTYDISLVHRGADGQDVPLVTLPPAPNPV